MIHLAGPGGAGKTTTGAALAARLGIQFVDLDARFAAHHGPVGDFIDRNGYHAYASLNVDLASVLVQDPRPVAVVALSSGFMTYEPDVHPGYPGLRQDIGSSESTFILLPSLDQEACVKEIVRRQLQRSFARTPEREEQVIRERFPIYANLPARKVETMKAIDLVVADIVRCLGPLLRSRPEPSPDRTGPL